MGGITATAAIKGCATALVIPATVAIASVESIFPAAVVGATTATAGLSLLVLVLLLATLATLCMTALVGLLWVLKHACRGLVANALQSIWSFPCMALMEVLLLHRLYCVAAIAAPKLESALVREVADGLSFMAFMP